MPSEALSTRPMRPDPPLQVWLLCDDRPGHHSQLQGIAEALARLTDVQTHWLPVSRHGTNWRQVLRRHYHGPRPDTSDHNAPDIAIAAGHRTHRELLALRRAMRCFCCVLMSPTLPLRSFDAVIAPRHDGLREHPRLLITEGVLNPVPPQHRIDPERGLILIGGESAHYRFNAEGIVHSIRALCQRFAGIHWRASNSRRTPPALLDALCEARLPNLELFDYRSTEAGWISAELGQCAQVWVSEDSVSMLYEALSAGACTGLLPVPSRRPGRVQRGVQWLLESGQLNRLERVLAGDAPKPPATPLREAERAARWLLSRWQLAAAAVDG